MCVKRNFTFERIRSSKCYKVFFHIKYRIKDVILDLENVSLILPIYTNNLKNFIKNYGNSDQEIPANDAKVFLIIQLGYSLWYIIGC